MKYCLKCGTLLEDSHEICIGCGANVIPEDAWSLYPPEMTKNIEIEKKEKKSRGGLIVAMVVVFVLLVAMVSVFVIYNIKKQNENPGEKTEQQVEETVEDVPEETAVAEVAEAPQIEEVVEEEPVVDIPTLEIPDAVSEPEEAAPAGEREILDSQGKYYSLAAASDAGGNLVFTTVYPEDFSEVASQMDYDIYSTRFPEKLTYIVSNDDGNVRMIYMSPQHFWYRKSDKGQSRTNERDIKDYMQFLTYGGAEGYIDALIKQSYKDLKSYKLIDKEEFSTNVSEKLSAVSNDHTMELTGEIGDYAKISSDAVYAAMQAECDAYIYHYEAVSRHGNTIYMDFYVPVVANVLSYVTERQNDKGEITEWIMPEFIAFEAGNEELYNAYKDAFKMFIYNSRLTDEFFYLNYSYAQEIESAISAGRDPEKLNAEKLKKLHSSYSSSAATDNFTKGIKEFLNVSPDSCTKLSGEKNIIADNLTKVGFYSSEKNKVFISPAENEYPGNDYSDLDFQPSSVTAESSDSESPSASE